MGALLSSDLFCYIKKLQTNLLFYPKKNLRLKILCNA